jgi:mercuric ion transport protein
MKKPAPENASILAGTVSALGASTCCLLPLALVSVGLGGAWVAQLRTLERFYPVFVAVALGAFAFGFYRLYIRLAPCEAASACVPPVTQRRQRVAFWTSLVFAKFLILSPFLYGPLFS